MGQLAVPIRPTDVNQLDEPVNVVPCTEAPELLTRVIWLVQLGGTEDVMVQIDDA